jgi:hypothetical protein
MFQVKKALIAILLIYAAVGYTMNQTFRNVWHPTYRGERLDYCSCDHRACGRALATRYCKILGYDRASNHAIAYNVGLTHYLHSRMRCTGWTCKGFTFITCASRVSHTPPKPYHYTNKVYVNPRFGHYLVDWCYKRNSGCGLRAASAFCSHMGYLKASAITKQSCANATKTIGSQELCFGKQCNAFQRIVCYR